MGSGPKPQAQYIPPPPPTPTANDAAEGADRLQEDIRKKRRSIAGSFLAGNSGGAATTGTTTGTTTPTSNGNTSFLS
jgi:hypothetical protein